MKRSGHHALILWLAAHFPGPLRHVNDAKQFQGGTSEGQEDPTVSRLLPSLDDQHAWQSQTGGAPASTIFSYEDVDLSAEMAGGDAPGSAPTLLCLRDPYNMLASRYALW